eukprot:gene16203-22039_t
MNETSTVNSPIHENNSVNNQTSENNSTFYSDDKFNTNGKDNCVEYQISENNSALNSDKVNINGRDKSVEYAYKRWLRENSIIINSEKHKDELVITYLIWPHDTVLSYAYGVSGMLICLIVGAKNLQQNANSLLSLFYCAADAILKTYIAWTKQLSFDLNRNHKSGAAKVRGFYYIIEAATEYLSTASDNKRTNCILRPYTNYVLLLFLLGFPLFSVVSLVIAWINMFDSCFQYPAFHTSHINCDKLHFQSIMYLGFIVEKLVYMLAFQIAGVLLATLLYGCDLANALTVQWTMRFQPLRRIDKKKVGQFKQLTELTPHKDLVKLTPELIQRDAHERYLVVQNYMHESSVLWGKLLAAVLVTGGFALAVVLYVIICVAYANGAVDRIAKGFKYAAEKDFELLGSRESWLTYIEQAPIYWYIFGFAITRPWLFSFIGGGISAIVGGVIMSYA